jgi:hypothetical protein
MDTYLACGAWHLGGSLDYTFRVHSYLLTLVHLITLQVVLWTLEDPNLSVQLFSSGKGG